MQKRRRLFARTEGHRPVYTVAGTQWGGGAAMRGRNSCWFGFFALALGSAILIVAIFPVGFLMFLVAFLLIVCGCDCIRRR